MGVTKRLLPQAVKKLGEDGGTHFAAAISFRVLFSVFPLAIVVVSAFGLVARATGLRADVVDAIVRNVPLTADGKAQLQTLLEGATGNASTLGLIALVGLIWAAGGMMASIRAAMNAAFDVVEERPFVQGKLVDMMLVFGAAVLVGLSLVSSIGARMVARYASDWLAGGHLGTVASTVLGGALVPLALGFGAALFLYRFVPATTRPLRELLPGALLFAVVFVLLENLFAVYLEHFTNYNALYGSLGAMISFLLFVYVASLAFLFGAELSASLPLARDELRAGIDDDPDERSLRERAGDALRGLVRKPAAHEADRRS